MRFNQKTTDEAYKTAKIPNKDIAYFKNDIKSGNKQI